MPWRAGMGTHFCTGGARREEVVRSLHSLRRAGRGRRRCTCVRPVMACGATSLIAVSTLMWSPSSLAVLSVLPVSTCGPLKGFPPPPPLIGGGSASAMTSPPSPEEARSILPSLFEDANGFAGIPVRGSRAQRLDEAGGPAPSGAGLRATERNGRSSLRSVRASPLSPHGYGRQKSLSIEVWSWETREGCV